MYKKQTRGIAAAIRTWAAEGVEFGVEDVIRLCKSGGLNVSSASVQQTLAHMTGARQPLDRCGAGRYKGKPEYWKFDLAA